MIDITNHEQLLKTICSFIKEASLLLYKDIVATSKEYNPSTNIDIEINNYLISRLNSISNIPIISEESPPITDLIKSELAWVIDPLDGTLNVLTKNIPFCISISLVNLKYTKAILSCSYVPHSGDFFTAISGKGAFLNEVKIVAEQVSHKIISYGLPNDTMFNIDFHLKHIKSILTEGFITRQSGSAIYDILLTSLGKNYAFYEFGLFLWDFIGPDLVATECGCKSFFKKINKDSYSDLKFNYIVARDENGLKHLKELLLK